MQSVRGATCFRLLYFGRNHENQQDCRILDLTKELSKLNPFVRESIDWHVEIRSLLNRLGEEMSHPLERADDKRTLCTMSTIG
jgi:hypothetical protein